jgi:PTH1 family peptidyl-tRNA hydrolase
MKLIVGLGNPGREFEATWHNLGFMVIDKLFERGGGRRFRSESEALVSFSNIRAERVLLVKPQTMMNLSGNAVAPLLDRYGEGDPSNLLVALDDAALPLGMIRVRAHGSDGGQKGLRSIIDRSGTQRFPRIRLGIKPDHPVAEMVRFVLSPIPRSDRERVDEMVERAADAVEVVIADGVGAAMNSFNERARPAGDEAVPDASS